MNIKDHQRGRESEGHGANIQGRRKLNMSPSECQFFNLPLCSPMIILISWFEYFKSDIDILNFLYLIFYLTHASYPKRDPTLISGSINMHHAYLLIFTCRSKPKRCTLHLSIKDICLKMCIILRIIFSYCFPLFSRYFYTLDSAAYGSHRMELVVLTMEPHERECCHSEKVYI